MMDEICDTLKQRVLSIDQLHQLISPRQHEGKQKQSDVIWLKVFRQLLTRVSQSASETFFKNVSRFILINISNMVKTKLKHPEQIVKKDIKVFTKLLTSLHCTLDNVDLPVAEVSKLKSVILAAVIDMRAARVRPGIEQSTKSHISSDLSSMWGHSDESMLDTLLHSRTLLCPKTRQPQIFLPLIKRVISRAKTNRRLSPESYLKYLLLGKLWLFMTNKAELVRARGEIVKCVKMPTGLRAWAEQQGNTWVTDAGDNTRHILRNMTVSLALKALYGEDLAIPTAGQANQELSKKKKNQGVLLETPVARGKCVSLEYSEDSISRKSLIKMQTNNKRTCPEAHIAGGTPHSKTRSSTEGVLKKKDRKFETETYEGVSESVKSKDTSSIKNVLKKKSKNVKRKVSESGSLDSNIEKGSMPKKKSRKSERTVSESGPESSRHKEGSVPKKKMRKAERTVRESGVQSSRIEERRLPKKKLKRIDRMISENEALSYIPEEGKKVINKLHSNECMQDALVRYEFAERDNPSAVSKKRKEISSGDQEIDIPSKKKKSKAQVQIVEEKPEQFKMSGEKVSVEKKKKKKKGKKKVVEEMEEKTVVLVNQDEVCQLQSDAKKKKKKEERKKESDLSGEKMTMPGIFETKRDHINVRKKKVGEGEGIVKKKKKKVEYGDKKVKANPIKVVQKVKKIKKAKTGQKKLKDFEGKKTKPSSLPSSVLQYDSLPAEEDPVEPDISFKSKRGKSKDSKRRLSDFGQGSAAVSDQSVLPSKEHGILPDHISVKAKKGKSEEDRNVLYMYEQIPDRFSVKSKKGKSKDNKRRLTANEQKSDKTKSVFLSSEEKTKSIIIKHVLADCQKPEQNGSGFTVIDMKGKDGKVPKSSGEASKSVARRRKDFLNFGVQSQDTQLVAAKSAYLKETMEDSVASNILTKEGIGNFRTVESDVWDESEESDRESESLNIKAESGSDIESDGDRCVVKVETMKEEYESDSGNDELREIMSHLSTKKESESDSDETKETMSCFSMKEQPESYDEEGVSITAKDETGSDTSEEKVNMADVMKMLQAKTDSDSDEELDENQDRPINLEPIRKCDASNREMKIRNLKEESSSKREAESLVLFKNETDKKKDKRSRIIKSERQDSDSDEDDSETDEGTDDGDGSTSEDKHKGLRKCAAKRDESDSSGDEEEPESKIGDNESSIASNKSHPKQKKAASYHVRQSEDARDFIRGSEKTPSNVDGSCEVHNDSIEIVYEDTPPARNGTALKPKPSSGDLKKLGKIEDMSAKAYTGMHKVSKKNARGLNANGLDVRIVKNEIVESDYVLENESRPVRDDDEKDEVHFDDDRSENSFEGAVCEVENEGSHTESLKEKIQQSGSARNADDSDSDLKIILVKEAPTLRALRRRRRHRDWSDIDEASGSEDDIVPCDEKTKMFTDEETQAYHKKLKAVEIQRKVEKIIKQEEEVLKWKEKQHDIDQDAPQKKTDNSNSVLSQADRKSDGNSVNRMFNNLYRSNTSVPKGSRHQDPTQNDKEACTLIGNVSKNGDFEKSNDVQDTTGESKEDDVRSITASQNHSCADVCSQSFPSVSSADDEAVDEISSSDTEKDIEIVLQTILKDTGRKTSIQGLREILLNDIHVKEEPVDTEEEEDPKDKDSPRHSSLMGKVLKESNYLNPECGGDSRDVEEKEDPQNKKEDPQIEKKDPSYEKEDLQNEKDPPNDKGDPPNEKEDPPDEKAALPNEKDGPLNDKEDPPDEKEGPSNETEHPPNEKEGPPNEKKGLPCEKQDPPNEKEGLPYENEYPPNENKDLQNEKEGPPNDKEDPSDEKEGPPDEKEGPPDEKEGPSIEKEGPSIEKEGPSIEKEGPPNEKEGPPNEKEGPSNEKEGPPNEKEGPPDEKEGPPNEKEGLPYEKEDPTNEKEDPTKEKEDPTKEKEDPTNENEDPTYENKDPAGENEPTNENEDPTNEKEDPTNEKEDPTNEKEDPTNESEDPTNESEDPTNEKEDPTNESKDPTNESKDPTNENEDPTNENEDPTNENEDPTNGNEDPTNEKEDPTNEKKVPQNKMEGPQNEDGPQHFSLINVEQKEMSYQNFGCDGEHVENPESIETVEDAPKADTPVKGTCKASDGTAVINTNQEKAVGECGDETSLQNGMDGEGRSDGTRNSVEDGKVEYFYEKVDSGICGTENDSQRSDVDKLDEGLESEYEISGCEDAKMMADKEVNADAENKNNEMSHEADMITKENLVKNGNKSETKQLQGVNITDSKLTSRESTEKQRNQYTDELIHEETGTGIGKDAKTCKACDYEIEDAGSLSIPLVEKKVSSEFELVELPTESCNSHSSKIAHLDSCEIEKVCLENINKNVPDSDNCPTNMTVGVEPVDEESDIDFVIKNTGIESLVEESKEKFMEGGDEAYEAGSDASEDPIPKVKRRTRSLRKTCVSCELNEVSDSDVSPVRKRRRRRTLEITGMTCQKSQRSLNTGQAQGLGATCSENESAKYKSVSRKTSDGTSGAVISTRSQNRQTLSSSDSEILCRTSKGQHALISRCFHSHHSDKNTSVDLFAKAGVCDEVENSEMQQNLVNGNLKNDAENISDQINISADKLSSQQLREEIKYKKEGDESDDDGSCLEKIVKDEELVTHGGDSCCNVRSEYINGAEMSSGIETEEDECITENMNDNLNNSTEYLEEEEGEELEVLSTSGLEGNDEFLYYNDSPKLSSDGSVKEVSSRVSPKTLTYSLGRLSRAKGDKKDNSDSALLPAIPHLKANCVSKTVLTKELIISPEVSDEECELMSPAASDDLEMGSSESQLCGSEVSKKQLSLINMQGRGARRNSGGIRSPQKMIPEEQDESTPLRKSSRSVAKSRRSHLSTNSSQERSRSRSQGATGTPGKGSSVRKQPKGTDSVNVCGFGLDLEAEILRKNLRSSKSAGYSWEAVAQNSSARPGRHSSGNTSDSNVAVSSDLKENLVCKTKENVGNVNNMTAASQSLRITRSNRRKEAESDSSLTDEESEKVCKTEGMLSKMPTEEACESKENYTLPVKVSANTKSLIMKDIGQNTQSKVSSSEELRKMTENQCLEKEKSEVLGREVNNDVPEVDVVIITASSLISSSPVRRSARLRARSMTPSSRIESTRIKKMFSFTPVRASSRLQARTVEETISEHPDSADSACCMNKDTPVKSTHSRRVSGTPSSSLVRTRCLWRRTISEGCSSSELDSLDSDASTVDHKQGGMPHDEIQSLRHRLVQLKK